jgi:hypothetical protein
VTRLKAEKLRVHEWVDEVPQLVRLDVAVVEPLAWSWSRARTSMFGDDGGELQDGKGRWVRGAWGTRTRREALVGGAEAQRKPLAVAIEAVPDAEEAKDSRGGGGAKAQRLTARVQHPDAAGRHLGKAQQQQLAGGPNRGGIWRGRRASDARTHAHASRWQSQFTFLQNQDVPVVLVLQQPHGLLSQVVGGGSENVGDQSMD